MAAGLYNMVVEQGATFKRTITWRDPSNNPLNLTGYTARLQMRTNLTDATPFLDLTTENGGITLGGALGTITLLGSSTATALIDTKKGIYDLELIQPNGEVIRLLEGKVVVTFEVTH